MWDLALSSIKLFIAGKLFQDPVAVLRLSLLGMAITATITVLLFVLGVPLLAAAAVGGVAGGALQPILFKDLKYQ